MALPYNPILTGSFVSDGAAKTVNLPSDIIKFELFNITYFGSTAGNTLPEYSWWVKGLPNGYGYIGNKTNGAATIAITTMSTSNAFTLVDPTGTPFSSAVAVTASSNADPIVVSTGSTAGLISGDTVRIYSSLATWGAFQILGFDWTIGNIVANTSFELTYTGVAPGSAGTAISGTFWRKVNIDSPFYPKNRTITNISKAASAVIEMSVTHGFTAGQLVRIYCPPEWGMSEIDGMLANITSVDTATNHITVDIDSTTFTTFAYPTSATFSAGVDFPQVVPVGETANSTYANVLDDATVNQSSFKMKMGTSVVGAASDTMRWIAYRGMSL